MGKRLPTYAEFCQAAAGSPEGQDGNNTYAWSATGNTGRQKTGYVANAISALNIRDLVGNVWKWLDEFCLDPNASSWTGTTYWARAMATLYSVNTALHALLGGGRWDDGVPGGSRAVNAADYPWHVNGGIGVWCVCDAQ